MDCAAILDDGLFYYCTSLAVRSAITATAELLVNVNVIVPVRHPAETHSRTKRDDNS